MKIKKFHIHENDKSEGMALIGVIIVPALMLLALPLVVQVSLIPAQTQAKNRDNQVSQFDSQIHVLKLQDAYRSATSLPSESQLEANFLNLESSGSDACIMTDFNSTTTNLSAVITCEKGAQSNSANLLISLNSEGTGDSGDSGDSGETNNSNSLPFDGEEWERKHKATSKKPCDTDLEFDEDGKYSPDHIQTYFDANPVWTGKKFASNRCYQFDS